MNESLQPQDSIFTPDERKQVENVIRATVQHVGQKSAVIIDRLADDVNAAMSTVVPPPLAAMLVNILSKKPVAMKPDAYRELISMVHTAIDERTKALDLAQGNTVLADEETVDFSKDDDSPPTRVVT